MLPPDQVPPVDVEPNPEKPGMPSKDSCNMAMLAHLLGALIGFLGPLIIWLVKKDTDPFVDDQGKEALNFQITILIAYAISIVLVFISCGFLFFLPLIPFIVSLVFGILAALEASKGIAYRYAIAIRLVR